MQRTTRNLKCRGTWLKPRVHSQVLPANFPVFSPTYCVLSFSMSFLLHEDAEKSFESASAPMQACLVLPTANRTESAWKQGGGLVQVQGLGAAAWQNPADLASVFLGQKGEEQTIGFRRSIGCLVVVNFDFLRPTRNRSIHQEHRTQNWRPFWVAQGPLGFERPAIARDLVARRLGQKRPGEVFLLTFWLNIRSYFSRRPPLFERLIQLNLNELYINININIKGFLIPWDFGVTSGVFECVMFVSMFARFFVSGCFSTILCGFGAVTSLSSTSSIVFHPF